jgi:hypothetical protein
MTSTVAVVVKKTLEEVKSLLCLLRDSIKYRQLTNESRHPEGYKESVKLSLLLKAQNHSEDTIIDISRLLGSLNRKPANVLVFVDCGLELVMGNSPIQRAIYHTYGVDLDVDKFKDINLIPKSNPISEAKIVIKKSEIKADLVDDIQITLEPSKHQTITAKRICHGKYNSHVSLRYHYIMVIMIIFRYFCYAKLSIQFNCFL